MCTGSRSVPRQGLPGVRQDPSLFILLPFKNKVLTEKTRPRQEELAGKDKAPARGACREGQPKHVQKTCHDAPRVLARPDGRQACRHDKRRAAARHLSRQGCHLTPKIQRVQQRVTPGPPQEHVARRCTAMRSEVASGADRDAVVATGGSPNGRFFALLGRPDGH